ncbi:MAG: hypothetical protein ACYS32_19350 [Planctomycetota bacterium]|jgi:hypothetical protein
MAKDEKKEKLFNQLGHKRFAVGLQMEVCERENAKRTLQVEENKIATEIQKFNG